MHGSRNGERHLLAKIVQIAKLPSLGQMNSGKHSHGDTAGEAEQPTQQDLFLFYVEKEAALGTRTGGGLIPSVLCTPASQREVQAFLESSFVQQWRTNPVNPGGKPFPKVISVGSGAGSGWGIMVD